MSTEKEQSHLGSIARALSVLEFLDASQRGWNISELSRKLNVPKSTMHLIVLTLERHGYILRELGSRKYTLAVKVWDLGRGLMRNVLMPDIALTHLHKLVKNVQLTVHLAILEHHQAIYVQKVNAPGLIQFDTYVGKHTNLHCTAVGKVLLAHAAAPRLVQFLEREPFARYTRHTIAYGDQLSKELAKVRQQGYAVDDQEEEIGVRCVAVPVFSKTGECVAALGVTGTIDQVRSEAVQTFAGYLRDTGQSITCGVVRVV